MNKAAEETKILRLAKSGCWVSVFWTTENQNRARAMDDLIKSGAIHLIKKQYPWFVLKLPTDALAEKEG